MDKSLVSMPLSAPPHHPDPRALKILAKSIFRELRGQGYGPTQILSLATEIVSLVTSDLAHDTDTHR
jgi:hypothetical protein